jgi:hypothetical protein
MVKKARKTYVSRVVEIRCAVGRLDDLAPFFLCGGRQ